jgi:outer membrane protein assembly factor BamB
MSVWADYYSVYQEGAAEYVAGRRFNGGNIRQPLGFNRSTTLLPNEEQGYGALKAINPKTGEMVWQVKFADLTEGGCSAQRGT